MHYILFKPIIVVYYIMLPDRPSTPHIVPLPRNCPLVRVKIRLQSLSDLYAEFAYLQPLGGVKSCIALVFPSAEVILRQSPSWILPESSKLSTKPVGQYMAGSVCLK